MSIPSDDSLDELPGDDGNVAVLEPTSEPVAAVASGPCCEKCSAPFKSDKVTVCRRCGWYSSLKQYVEVDHNYEAYHDDDLPQPVKEAPKSHVQVWTSLLPRWSWILIATFVLIVVESVVARVVTDANGSVRMYWSLAQFAIGLTAFLGCHIFNFLVSATDDTDVGFLDVFIRPVALWLRALRNLPRRLWVADGALGGATAVLMSLLVIGALPYDSLWNWGGEKKKPNLLAAAVQQAQNLPSKNNGSLAEAVGGVQGKEGGSDNLEDAVGDLAKQGTPKDGESKDGDDAGKGGNGDAGADGSGQATKQNDPAARQQIVCVILGYRLDGFGHVSSLVLGALHDDKLTYAGIVTPPTDDAALIDLTDDLERSQIQQPEVPLYVQANWVLPKFVCQVNYHQRESDGRLIDIQWEGLRGKLAPPTLTRPSSTTAARQQ